MFSTFDSPKQHVLTDYDDDDDDGGGGSAPEVEPIRIKTFHVLLTR